MCERTGFRQILREDKFRQDLRADKFPTPSVTFRPARISRMRPSGPVVHAWGGTSWPPQAKVFIWPPFFQHNTRRMRQKTGGACLYMPQDGHWLASFEVIPPPPKVSFPTAKKMKFHTENCFPDPFFFWRFLSLRRKFCHAVLDSRDDQGLPPD